jgi:hypothetical protein
MTQEQVEQRACPNGHVFMVSLLAKELAYFPGIITLCPRCGEQSWRTNGGPWMHSLWFPYPRWLKDSSF